MGGLFGLNGLLGYFISIILLLLIVFGLGYAAVITQRTQGNNPYVIDNANALEMINKANAQHFKDSVKGE